MAERPLRGLRVLELARVLAGPWIGQTLADLGADVIKVESPEGDETRGWGPPFAADGSAAYFHAANRGKRAIALDFRDPADLALARRLAGAAEVVVENFKVGGLAKFGLDHASVAAGNPAVVYCSVTGFGQDGPDAPRAGYDFIVQAMGGIMDLTGEPDGEPQKPGVAYADLFTGLYGTVAVLAALRLSRPHRPGAVDRHEPLRRPARGAGEPGDELPDRRRGPAPHGQRPPQHRALPGVRGRRRAAGDRLRQRRPVRPGLRGAGARRCTATRASAATPTGWRIAARSSRRWRRASERSRAPRCWRRWRRAGCRRGRSTASPRPSPSRRRSRGAWWPRSTARGRRGARYGSRTRWSGRSGRRRGATPTGRRSGRRSGPARTGRSPERNISHGKLCH